MANSLYSLEGYLEVSHLSSPADADTPQRRKPHFLTFLLLFAFSLSSSFRFESSQGHIPVPAHLPSAACSLPSLKRSPKVITFSFFSEKRCFIDIFRKV